MAIRCHFLLFLVYNLRSVRQLSHAICEVPAATAVLKLTRICLSNRLADSPQGDNRRGPEPQHVGEYPHPWPVICQLAFISSHLRALCFYRTAWFGSNEPIVPYMRITLMAPCPYAPNTRSNRWSALVAFNRSYQIGYPHAGRVPARARLHDRQALVQLALSATVKPRGRCQRHEGVLRR